MAGQLYLTRRIVTALALVVALALILASGIGADLDTGGEPLPCDESFKPPRVPILEEPAAEVSASTGNENYLFVSASAFTPQDETMAIEYAQGGCVYRTAGDRYSEYAVQLPQGAVIDHMMLYYYDNNATYNVAARLYAFDGFGAYDLIASVASSGALDADAATGSVLFSHTVDNAAESLQLRLDYDTAGTSDLRICGVRLRYHYSPLWATMLPYVEK